MKIKINNQIVDADVFFERVKTKGRPKKILTETGCEIISKLSQIFCTQEEIADLLGISVDTLHNEENDELFRNAFKRGRASGKQSIRHKQYELSMLGNPTMLMWMGRQFLGQSEKVNLNSEVTVSTNGLEEQLKGLATDTIKQLLDTKLRQSQKTDDDANIIEVKDFDIDKNLEKLKTNEVLDLLDKNKKDNIKLIEKTKNKKNK